MQAQKTEYLENFAARLRSAMDREGLTLREVATSIGKSTSTVGAWTQGKNWPEVEVQIRLSECLHVPVDWLIHGITERAEIPAQVEEDKTAFNVSSAVADDVSLELRQKKKRLAVETTAKIKAFVDDLIAAAQNDPNRL